MKFNVIEMEIERGSKSDESNESLPLGCASKARLYKNDPALPVYTWGLTKGMSTNKVTEILINGSVNVIRSPLGFQLAWKTIQFLL